MPENFRLNIPSPLQEIDDQRLRDKGVRLLLKRDDLINPEVPGNKWRKLKYNVEAARNSRHDLLLTFGGAHSNHLRAVAAIGKYFNFRTVGVVRGEEHLPLNDTLRYAIDCGMHLTYLDRTTYRARASDEVVGSLHARFGDFYLLPEGGSNALAARGCAELPAEIDEPMAALCCSCGTGGTLAGIAAGLRPGVRAIGFSALKGGQFLAAEVSSLQRAAFGAESANWTIEYDYHFGGFAKFPPALVAFAKDFHDHHGVDLELVYEAKMIYGVLSLVEHDAFRSGDTVVAVVNA